MNSRTVEKQFAGEGRAKYGKGKGENRAVRSQSRNASSFGWHTRSGVEVVITRQSHLSQNCKSFIRHTTIHGRLHPTRLMTGDLYYRGEYSLVLYYIAGNKITSDSGLTGYFVSSRANLGASR